MKPDKTQTFTLEQLSRALAAHAYLVARPNDALGFLAPEIYEQYADFIFRTAQGERVARPKPTDQA